MAISVTLPSTYTDETGTPGVDLDLLDLNVAIGDEVIAIAIGPDPIFTTTDALSAVIPFIGKLYITQVVSEQVFHMEGYNPDGTVALIAKNTTLLANGSTGTPNIGAVAYKIVHALNRNDQVADVAAAASAFGNKRVNLIWPDEGVIIDDDGKEQLVNGTFLCAALAGAKSAYPAQQSFTNLGFPGPYKLRHSNDYLTKIQMDDLSAAGVNVIVQDADGAQVYSRHQRTTDVAFFENSELSIVTAVDKVSLDLIETLKPYIGKYNITDNFLNFIFDASTQYLFSAKSQQAPMCGSLIIDGKVEGVRAQIHGQNMDLSPGVIELTIGCEFPKPANYINIKLLIS